MTRPTAVAAGDGAAVGRPARRQPLCRRSGAAAQSRTRQHHLPAVSVSTEVLAALTEPQQRSEVAFTIMVRTRHSRRRKPRA